MRLLFTFSKIILLIGIIVNHNSVLSQNAGAGGSTCANMAPICTSVGATFQAGTGASAQSGPNYGCLLTQPNPSWYFFEVATKCNLIWSNTLFFLCNQFFITIKNCEIKKPRANTIKAIELTNNVKSVDKVISQDIIVKLEELYQSEIKELNLPW